MFIVYHKTQTQTPTHTQTKTIQAGIENKKDIMYIYKLKFNKSLLTYIHWPVCKIIMVFEPNHNVRLRTVNVTVKFLIW